MENNYLINVGSAVIELDECADDTIWVAIDINGGIHQTYIDKSDKIKLIKYLISTL